MTGAQTARRALAIALTPSALLAPGCVGVLDLDGYSEAVQELCKCDMDVPRFGGACVDVLTTRLDSVSEETRAEWLAYFGEHCGGRCDDAFACYQQSATCSEISCTEDRECCGFDAGAFCDLPDGGTNGECKGG